MKAATRARLTPEQRKAGEAERAEADKLRGRRHRAWLRAMEAAKAGKGGGLTLAMLDPHVEDWTKPGEQACQAHLEHYGPRALELSSILGRPEAPEHHSRRVLALARLDQAWRSWVGAHPEAILDEAHPAQAWLTDGPRVVWRVLPAAPARPTTPRHAALVAPRSGGPRQYAVAPRPGGERASMPRPRHP
jgi:hypothetical protein